MGTTRTQVAVVGAGLTVANLLRRNGISCVLVEEQFRFEGARHVVNYGKLSGRCHFVYPQQELVTDLIGAYTDGGGDARFSVRDVRLDTTAASVTYTDSTGTHVISCDFIAGCDGARGVSQTYFDTPPARHDYGTGWLALLAKAGPSAPGVIFGIHPRGFAAHMDRGRTVREARAGHAQLCAPRDVTRPPPPCPPFLQPVSHVPTG